MVKIERYGVNGEGVALCQGKVVFVPYSLVGENVDITVQKDNKSFAIATLNSISSPSLQRIEPICPYYTKCGGCQIMHASYQEQLKIKHDIVTNNLKKFAKYDGKIEEVFASDKVYNYRNHITFAVSKEGKLGFFEPKGHTVLPIKNCHLADDCINKCIDIFNSYFFDNRLYGYDYQTGKGVVKQVDIKYLDNQLLITIVATTFDLPNLEHLMIRLNLLRQSYGLYISKNDSPNTLIYGKLKHICGIKSIESTENGISSNVSSFSFVQINNYIRENIYQNIAKNIDATVVLDAYAGRGVLTSLVAKTAKKVYAVEIIESSVQDGLVSMQKNNIKNVTYINDDIKNAIDNITEKIDCIILDPPRKGVEKQVLESVLNKSPKNIIYLSCASDTLARDLSYLMNNYTIKLVQPYDMFPNTCNIETLVILEKK